MRELVQEFLAALDREDKESAVHLAKQMLEAGEVGIVQLYNDVLAPALNDWGCLEGDSDICVWREHVRSSIVRTILEIAYPYMLKERDARGTPRKAVAVTVLCPPDELHEIGPRMVADFFTLAGYDVTFVGANTPIDDLITAVRQVRPRYVAISVTNFYHLIAVRKAIERLRGHLPEGTEILVGGRAFGTNPGKAMEVGADRLLGTFEDIQALDGGA
jgi:methanogenic corrinoid protein MtbC1